MKVLLSFEKIFKDYFNINLNIREKKKLYLYHVFRVKWLNSENRGINDLSHAAIQYHI